MDKEKSFVSHFVVNKKKPVAEMLPFWRVTYLRDHIKLRW